MKSGVEHLANHPGWRTRERIRPRFWDLLSGKIEYFVQWEAWDRMCRSFGADPDAVLGLLNRAREATKRS